MNAFKGIVETVRGPLGASIESMVTTFLAGPEASVMRKGPMESGWILLALRVLVKRTRSLTVKSHFRAFWSKYFLLAAAAASSIHLDWRKGQAGYSA
uniref:Uncharacterized protein n=1 Tax=Romanomermis culicivorax TaxID=13658 RepID=A0A915IHN1_ROMCU